MLHTFVGGDEATAKQTIRGPFKRYLESSADLWQASESRLKDLPPRKKADMLEYAFERYYQKTALMGSVESCVQTVKTLHKAGADEIACLIDFGLSTQQTLQGMEHLDAVRRWRGGTGS
jgi:alkanesulfonate monooxygenase SsuD/methylene tetrahydromethanopterin reductase-like flavin-dependent oxidoreductase (luciferase family)